MYSKSCFIFTVISRLSENSLMYSTILCSRIMGILCISKLYIMYS